MNKSAPASNSGNQSEQVAKTLIDQITQGNLKAGDSLPTEQELGDQFGLSRLTVRESLSILDGIGIIDHTRGRRRVLKEMSPDVMTRMFSLMISLNTHKSFHDVFSVRRCMEPEIAKLAAQQRNEEQLSSLNDCLQRYEACLHAKIPETEKLITAVEIDVEFHQTIATASGNPIFPLILEALSRYLSQVQIQSCQSNLEKNRSAHEAHIRIVDAITKQDPDLAALEMNVHLARSEDNLD